MTAQAGWYVDPRDSTQYRYWDGERWSQSTQPIPTENAGLAGGDAASSTLASGGTAEPIGSVAFGSGAAHAADETVAASAGSAPADLMWTSGFGDEATSSRPASETFSPDQAGGETTAAAPSPWQPTVDPAAIDAAATPFVGDQQATPPSAFTPSAPSAPSAGAPMFVREGGSDPAFAPEAPTPTPPVDNEAPAVGSKLDQYTMPAGHVPDTPSDTGKRSRRKRHDAEGAGAAAAGAAVGAAATGVDGPPKRRRKAADHEPSSPTPSKPSGSLPPGAKPVKGGSTSRLPLLLGILGVAVVGAAAFLFLRGDGEEDVATDTTATTAAPAATEPVAETTAPVAETTAPVAETTAPTVTAVDPAAAEALEQSFAAEVVRSCDIIKADPGRLTEDVIQYQAQWDAIGKSYEQLQRAVNECSQPARDAAYEAMVRGG